MTNLRFSKGGDGDSPVRTPDNLRSNDNVELVIGICEGEIEGLENGEKSFYVGDTRLENENGSKNFDDFNLEILPGSGANEFLEYEFGGSARSTSVGVQLLQNVSVVRQTQAGDIDFVDLRFLIQSLYYQDDSGIYGSSLTLRLEYKGLSEKEWKNVLDNDLVITGKTTSSYVKEVRIALDRIEEPYEFRVTKLTEDGDGSSFMGIISWESFQEGNTTVKEYPYTALAHLRIKSSGQFSSIPEFTGIYKLAKVRIPTNYDPVTREYSGVWDGNFKLAWTDNPAWCLYDFIMNDRYGVNAYCPVTLDKWDTYEAAQWCDELVNDGRGGKEPRYTFNMVISDARNGREQAVYMAAAFNAILVEEATGYLRLKIDRDEQAVFLFTPENVEAESGFSYSFTSPETRYNDITVAFVNPEMEWQEDRRRIYNQDDIDKNGRVTYEYIAVGCIREGEALRRSYLKLISAITEKTIVNFKTNRAAQCLANFDVILISDPVVGYAIPGRIKGYDEDRLHIYLRDSIYLEAGVDYKISFDVPEGIVELEIDPVSGSGNLYEFILKQPLPENIPDYAVFSVHGSTLTGTPKPFRVTSIKEVEGSPETFEISAIEINRKKWEASDNMTFEVDQENSGLPSALDIPYALDVTFTEFYDRENKEMQLVIGTVLDHNAYPYYSDDIIVFSREVGTKSWTKRQVVNFNTIINHPGGRYEFVVLPTSILGNYPPFENAPVYVYDVTNMADPPSDVQNFTASRLIDGIQLSWDPVPDIDLEGYEIREGTDWDSAKLIMSSYQGNKLFLGLTDAEDHTYLIKAIDGLGNYSNIAAITTARVIPPADVQVFYVTVNKDNLRFDWEPVDGVDITYVIRQGTSWETSLEITRTKANSITVLLPSSPEITYCIKALSPIGLFSENPRYARPDMLLSPNRNIIVQVDNAAEGFPGITYGFTPVSYIEKTMAMNEDVSYAEHYFEVELDKVTRARNWFEIEAFAFGNRLKWTDLHYRYTQPEAHKTWINSKAIDAAGEINLVISCNKGTPYEGLLGFSLNQTLKDMTQTIDATGMTGITYQPARVTQGLSIDEDTTVEYEEGLDIPEIFSMTFRLKVDSQTSQNFLMMSLRNEEQFMYLYFSEGNLVLVCSDRKNITIPMKWISLLDFVTVGISQSANERSLYFFANYANFESSGTVEAAPLGNMTTFKIKKL